MKSRIVLFALLGIIVSGCVGGLKRQIDYDVLSRDDISFAENLDVGTITMNINSPSYKFSTNKSSSRWIILPPFLSYRAFGYGEYRYGYITYTTVIPLFTTGKSSLYNSGGYTIEKISITRILFLITRATTISRTKNSSYTNLFEAPLLGAFIGFGDDYFKFLFIPIKTPKKN